MNPKLVQFYFIKVVCILSLFELVDKTFILCYFSF